MANQNLSQFTEKTLVADADWVFVWDTANSISKKVSRNSLLNSGTLATSAPVTISQTWDAAGQTFKALVVNADGSSDANSASGSLLFDLQLNGVSQFRIGKTASLTVGPGNAKLEYVPGSSLSLKRSSDGLVTIALNPEANSLSAGTLIPTNKIANSALTASVDFGDGANTFAVRNGSAAQTFNVYGTYTSGTSYERLTLSAPSAANAIIGTNKGSSGGTARGLDFHTEGTARWTISTAGHFLAAADNTYDIGASGANRPRALYLAAGITAGGVISGQSYGASASGYFNWATRSQLTSPADGVIRLSNDAQNDFNRLQLGGTADTHPAIARDGAGIKITGAAAGLTSHIKVPAVAVASLPAAATAGVGARAFVNDATSPVFGSAVTGGGAVAVPVYSTGSAWNVG